MDTVSRIKNYRSDAPFSEKLRKNAIHYTGFAARAVFPIIHRVMKREKFKEGISVNLITKNDPWLYESLKSIEPYADEFVIIDSSSKKYLERNKRIFQGIKDKEVTYKEVEMDIFHARNYAHLLSTRNWILHWDGDMVAFDRGLRAFSSLMELISSLNPQYYYEIFFPLVNLGSDFTKVAKDKYHVEAWLYSNSTHFKWNLKKILKNNFRRIERPDFPLFYKKLYLNETYGLHLKFLSTDEKEAIKQLQFNWLSPEIKAEYGTYENFFSERKKGLNLQPSIDEQNIDRDIFDAIPVILEKYKNLQRNDIFERKESEMKI